MNHKMLRPFIVKVTVLGYFPLHNLKPNYSVGLLYISNGNFICII